MKTNLIVPVIFLFIQLCFAQESLSGRVLDRDDVGIAHAVVAVKDMGVSATTDANGYFSIEMQPVHTKQTQSASLQNVSISKTGQLQLKVSEKTLIEITAFNTRGRAIRSVSENANPGVHRINLPAAGSGVFMYKIKTDADELVIKGTCMSEQFMGNTQLTHLASPVALGKRAQADDNLTLEVVKEGFVDHRVTITPSDAQTIEIRPAPSEGTITDIDGNVYQTVKIGDQVWTVENFRTTRLNDSTPIAHVTNPDIWGNSDVNISYSTEGRLPTNGDPYPQYCFYNNTTDPDSVKMFGALYNWWVVNTGKLAPQGWRVPDTTDWNHLMDYLDESYDGDTVRIAKALSAGTDWKELRGSLGESMLSNNITGFAAVPAGYRTGTSMILYLFGGECTYWWCSTEAYPQYKRYFALYNYKNGRPTASSLSGFSPDFGMSVRLIKDSL